MHAKWWYQLLYEWQWHGYGCILTCSPFVLNFILERHYVRVSRYVTGRGRVCLFWLRSIFRRTWNQSSNERSLARMVPVRPVVTCGLTDGKLGTTCFTWTNRKLLKYSFQRSFIVRLKRITNWVPHDDVQAFFALAAFSSSDGTFFISYMDCFSKGSIFVVYFLLKYWKDTKTLVKDY